MPTRNVGVISILQVCLASTKGHLERGLLTMALESSAEARLEYKGKLDSLERSAKVTLADG
jgi:hypothetical protein